MKNPIEKKWYSLGQPWCHSSESGTAILAGSEDPHKADFLCDFYAFEEDRPEDYALQDARELCDHIIDLHNNWLLTRDNARGANDDLISALKSNHEWVSVGEKLPSSAMSQRVLVYSPERGVEHGYWSGDYFHGECDDVTHWMPLPEIPHDC